MGTMAPFLSLMFITAAFGLQMVLSQSVGETESDRKPYDVSISEIDDWTTDQWIVVSVVISITVVYCVVMWGACCKYVCDRRHRRVGKETSVPADRIGFGF